MAAEVTRDRNQKTESAEKEGGKQFWVCEINEDFGLTAPQPSRSLLISRFVASARGLIKVEIPLYSARGLFTADLKRLAVDLA
jgi:hypothetical protein